MKTNMPSVTQNRMFWFNKEGFSKINNTLIRVESKTPIIESIIETIVEPIIYKC